MTNERENFIIKDVYVQITEINIKMKMIRRRYSNKTPLILHWSESSDSCRVCYVTYRFYCPCFAKSTDCRIKQSKGIFFYNDLYQKRLQIACSVHDGLTRKYSHRPSSVRSYYTILRNWPKLTFHSIYTHTYDHHKYIYRVEGKVDETVHEITTMVIFRVPYLWSRFIYYGTFYSHIFRENRLIGKEITLI